MQCVVASYEAVLAKLDSLLAELPGLAPGLAKVLALGGSLLCLSWESLSAKLAYLESYGERHGRRALLIVYLLIQHRLAKLFLPGMLRNSSTLQLCGVCAAEGSEIEYRYTRQLLTWTPLCMQA